jgi:site-specific recombinase XerD
MDIHILAEKFYDHSLFIRGYSKMTIRRYRVGISMFCRYAGITRVEQVNEDSVRAFFFNGRTERGWKPTTYITFYMSLTVFFQWCIQGGYLKKNPIESIEVPKLEKRLPFRLTKQDSLKLLEVVENYPFDSKFLRCRNHAIFSTFVFAGLRKQELLNLRFTDVDIENLTIFVRQGKGSKDRMVPMSFTLAQSLKRYADERKRANKACPQFFTSSTHDVGYTDSGLKRLVAQIRKSPRIVFTVHKLRHTFATLMLEGGCDIYSLSRMMGHSDIKTTTIYLSASVEHLRAQMVKHPLNRS